MPSPKEYISGSINLWYLTLGPSEICWESNITLASYPGPSFNFARGGPGV